MKKTALILLLSGAAYFMPAQKFSKVDFDSVKKTLSADTNLYNKLVERLARFDSTLTEQEYYLIYFGQVFSKKYDPYNSGEESEKFNEEYGAGKYKSAGALGEKILKKNPVNLTLLYRTANCFRETGNLVMKRRCNRAFFALLDCIAHSGDGISCESAYVVTSVGDEYILLSDLNLGYESQSLIGNCDMFKVEKNEKFNHKKIYFNTYWSLKKMEDLLLGK
jgi:hypothetical protein